MFTSRIQPRMLCAKNGMLQRGAHVSVSFATVRGLSRNGSNSEKLRQNYHMAVYPNTSGIKCICVLPGLHGCLSIDCGLHRVQT